MRTLRVGSSLPPHSTAFRAARETPARPIPGLGSGRSASSCIMKPWIRSATRSEHGATSSTQSGRADTTSIGSAAAGGAPSTSSTTSRIAPGANGLRDEAIGLAAHGLQQRVGRVVGGHHTTRGGSASVRTCASTSRPLMPGQPDVEQHHVERGVGAAWRAPQGPSAGLHDAVAGFFEQRARSRGATPRSSSTTRMRPRAESGSSR